MTDMTEIYEWQKTREAAVRAWGTIPEGKLEADIIEIFETQPALVAATISKLTVAFEAGRIHSPWPILRKNLQEATSPSRTAVATDSGERTKALQRAEAWIRTAGLHYPTEGEVVAHLFGKEETTPPLEWLEQLELETRGEPGRPLYEGLLKATIVKTREEGPQPIPDSGDGMLSRWRNTKTRDHILDVWRQHRPAGQNIDAQELERAEAWKAQHAQANKRRRPSPPEPA